jgi:hypothetical protein
MSCAIYVDTFLVDYRVMMRGSLSSRLPEDSLSDFSNSSYFSFSFFLFSLI